MVLPVTKNTLERILSDKTGIKYYAESLVEIIHELAAQAWCVKGWDIGHVWIESFLVEANIGFEFRRICGDRRQSEGQRGRKDRDKRFHAVDYSWLLNFD
jgi:hypothetical protein